MVPLPGTLLVTLNTIVQEVPAGIDPPASVTELAAFVIVPLHCGDAGVPEMVKFAGSVSVKLTPVRLVALLLFKVIVTVLTPFMAMLVGEYALVPVSAGVTTRLLWAGEIFVTPG